MGKTRAISYDRFNERLVVGVEPCVAVLEY